MLHTFFHIYQNISYIYLKIPLYLPKTEICKNSFIYISRKNQRKTKISYAYPIKEFLILVRKTIFFPMCFILDMFWIRLCYFIWLKTNYKRASACCSLCTKTLLIWFVFKWITISYPWGNLSNHILYVSRPVD